MKAPLMDMQAVVTGEAGRFSTRYKKKPLNRAAFVFLLFLAKLGFVVRVEHVYERRFA